MINLKFKHYKEIPDRDWSKERPIFISNRWAYFSDGTKQRCPPNIFIKPWIRIKSVLKKKEIK